jgi:hypothetical protein
MTDCQAAPNVIRLHLITKKRGIPMGRYRFEISVNDFLIKTHYTEHEKSGLDWCKRYMSRFQSKVANVKMKVAVLAKEKQTDNWKYHGQPYNHIKNLYKAPRILKVDGTNK